MKSSQLVAAGVCLALVLVSTSLAAGGPSIAAAPVVVSGQQNFGNTANMLQGSYGREYWRLQLTSGDDVTINFGIGASEMDLNVYLFAAGITDFNVLRENPVTGEDPQDNGKGQIKYVAPRSGMYPLLFQTCCSPSRHGPFDFVVYIKHGVKLFISARSSVSRTGSVTVQVRNPDGAPITDKRLKITLRGIWGEKARTLGKTTPSNGLASFRLNLPASLKGQTIRIRAIAQGKDYIGTLSVTRAVRVR